MASGDSVLDNAAAMLATPGTHLFCGLHSRVGCIARIVSCLLKALLFATYSSSQNW